MSAADAKARREFLRQVLEKECLLRGGRKLSAGGESNFYFDCKRATLRGDCLEILADWILDEVVKECAPDHIGGPTMGADFIAAAAAMRAHQRGLPLVNASVVRKEPKGHGTQNKIENAPAAGARVLVVEDVITTGSSIARACDEYIAADCVIAGIAVIIDREAGGKEEMEKKYGAPVMAMFCRADFPA